MTLFERTGSNHRTTSPRRHLRSRALTGSAAALLAVAVAVPALAITGAGTATAAVGPAAVGPAAVGTAATGSPAQQDPTAAMLAIFGQDWRATAVAGEITLTPGSRATHGLPAGYRASARTFGVAPQAGTLQSICTPKTEKGIRFSSCTLFLGTDTVVLQQRIAPVSSAPRTSTDLRFYRPRAAGSFQLAELVLTRATGATAGQAAAAEAWVQGQAPHLTRAVKLTTPAS